MIQRALCSRIWCGMPKRSLTTSASRVIARKDLNIDFGRVGFLRVSSRRFSQQSTEQAKGAVEENTSPLRFVPWVALGISIAGALDYLLYFPEPAKLVYKAAEECPEVQDALGTPIERSYFWEGSVQEFQASVQIPITGPKGSGVVSSRLVKDAGSNEWQPLMLLFRQGDTMMNLDPPPPPEVPIRAHGKVILPKKAEDVNESKTISKDSEESSSKKEGQSSV